MKGIEAEGVGATTGNIEVRYTHGLPLQMPGFIPLSRPDTAKIAAVAVTIADP